jgi:MoxR-like ATPase
MAKYLTYGASPRATIGMIEGAGAGLLRGRRYVLPEDITDLVPDVMRHRLVLSYEALAEGLTPTR